MPVDRSTLEAALVGYQAQAAKIEAAMAAIRKELGVRGQDTAGSTAEVAAPKRVFSAAAKRRIAAAQKKR